MQRYGLKGIVRFEDKFYRGVYANDAEALRATYADMDAWLKIFEPVQYKIDGRPVYVYATPLLRDDKPVGALAVFLDASGLSRAEWERWQFNALRFVVLGLVLSLIGWLIVRFTVTRPPLLGDAMPHSRWRRLAGYRIRIR